MAARLTVVVSQSAMRDSHASDLEETLVAELMMTSGLDATMIGPLEHVHPDDTDFICLNSFNHSFALVSWLPREHVAEHWNRLALEGEVVGLADQPSGTTGHKVLYLQLSPSAQLPSIVAQLKELLQQRNVKTVSIQLTSPRAAASPMASAAATALTASKPADHPKPEDLTVASHHSNDDDAEEEWQHLDQLVEDFDQLDL